MSMVLASSVGFAQETKHANRKLSSDEGVRKVKLGYYKLNLYPDLDDLETESFAEKFCAEYSMRCNF